MRMSLSFFRLDILTLPHFREKNNQQFLRVIRIFNFYLLQLDYVHKILVTTTSLTFPVGF